MSGAIFSSGSPVTGPGGRAAPGQAQTLFAQQNMGFTAGSHGAARRAFLTGSLAGLGLAALAAPGVLRAAVAEWSMVAMEDFPPYNYYRAQKFIGIDVDIMQAAAQLLGLTLSIRPLPWPRAILTFESGGVDGIFQVAPTRYRFRHWNMTGPIRMTRLSFAVRADDPRTAESVAGALLPYPARYDIAKLAGHRIGVVKGFTYIPEFDTAEGFLRDGSIDDLTSLRKLLLGRVTTVLGGAANLRFAAARLGIADRIHILAPPLAEQPRYVGFRRDAAGREKSALMQQALAELWISGQVDRILARHGEK